MLVVEKDLPLGAAEAEAVGQLPAQSFPECDLLLFRKLNQLIIVSLEMFPFLDYVGTVPVVAIVSTVSIAAAAAAAASSTTATTTTSSTACLRNANVKKKENT